MQNDLENYIRDNINSWDRHKPDRAVLERVLNDIEPLTKPRNNNVIFFSGWVKWAAASIIILLGLLASWRYSSYKTDVISLTKETKHDQKTDELFLEPSTEVNSEKNITKTANRKSHYRQRNIKQATIIRNEMSTVSERINKVLSMTNNVVDTISLINSLAQVLNTDPNVNVRLAALDELSNFHKYPNARNRLVASLRNQVDPVIQINIIHLMIQAKESTIIDQLEKMATDQQTDRSVRDIAYGGILQLSPNKFN